MPEGGLDEERKELTGSEAARGLGRAWSHKEEGLEEVRDLEKAQEEVEYCLQEEGRGCHLSLGALTSLPSLQPWQRPQQTPQPMDMPPSPPPHLPSLPPPPAARVFYLLKLLRPRFICRVTMKSKIPLIWLYACQAPIKADSLAVLSQYLWDVREVCRRDFFGSTDMLLFCGALFIFVQGDRFVSPRHEPICLAKGMLLWATVQGGGDIGENISTIEGTITALDGANFRHKEVTTTTMGPLTMATETGTHAFPLHSLLGEACLVVEAIIPLVDWIDQNETEWVSDHGGTGYHDAVCL